VIDVVLIYVNNFVAAAIGSGTTFTRRFGTTEGQMAICFYKYTQF